MAKLKKGWGWRILGGALGGALGLLIGHPVAGAALGYGLTSAATGKGVGAALLNGSDDWAKGQTGSGLTTAQIEQNNWNAEQAQEAYNRELEADSTKFQRQTSDMQAAGLNPALMYGDSVSGAGSVSGMQASGAGAGLPSGGLIDTIINVAFAKQRMELMKAEQRNIDADTELKGSQTILNQKNIPIVEQTLQNLRADKSLTEAQTKQVDKVLEWFDREKQASIGVQNAQAHLFDWDARVADQRIKNMSTEQKKMLQEITNLRQEVIESYSRIALNYQNAVTAGAQASFLDAQIPEIDSRIKMLDAMTGKLSAETGLTEKQLNWYWFEHGLMPIVGTAVGVAGAAASGGFLGPARSVVRGF